MINYKIVDSRDGSEEGYDAYSQAMWGLHEKAKEYTTVTPIVNGQFSYRKDGDWHIVEIVPVVEDDGA